jgi:hypothetical protein
LTSLQRLHYASNCYALLLIFQGMDAGSKDGAIRHVLSGVNPQAMRDVAALSGSEGSVLDPIAAIRYRMTLDPEQWATGLADLPLMDASTWLPWDQAR